MKNIRIFYLKIFYVLVVKFSIYLNRRVFVMYSKTGVYKGIYYFSYFCSKTYIVDTSYNRLVEAVLMSTRNLCFEKKYEKYRIFYLKTSIFFVW